MRYPIEVFYKPFDEKHLLISIHNVPFSDFLYGVRHCLISEMTIYWLDKEKDFISHSKPSCRIFDITSCFGGVDVLITSVELSLSNGFVIESNLEDEIYCRIPIHSCLDLTLPNLGKTQRAVGRNRLPRAPIIDWHTTEMEH